MIIAFAHAGTIITSGMCDMWRGRVREGDCRLPRVRLAPAIPRPASALRRPAPPFAGYFMKSPLAKGVSKRSWIVVHVIGCSSIQDLRHPLRRPAAMPDRSGMSGPSPPPASRLPRLRAFPSCLRPFVPSPLPVSRLPLPAAACPASRRRLHAFALRAFALRAFAPSCLRPFPPSLARLPTAAFALPFPPPPARLAADACPPSRLPAFPPPPAVARPRPRHRRPPSRPWLGASSFAGELLARLLSGLSSFGSAVAADGLRRMV